MDYKKAVEAALKGNESAFSALYESTQRDMYYIALKYMKNEEDAMDVLQDSYIKAWQSLATLKDPASFRAWFGRIVANTAKNALAKKRPMLFSQLEGENDEGEQFALDIEDEKSEFQPERSYTQKETQELVHELIDSLSDEQRLCILMYHLDDQSIKDIAETFGISENTVKSRLLYGRKAIKAKAEELQKKGYQLYTVAPVVFFLYLLDSEKASTVFAATANAVMQAQKTGILESAKASGNGAGAAESSAAGHGTENGFTFWKQWICFTSWWKPQLFWQYRQDSCIRRPQSGTDSCKTGVYSHRSRQGRSGSSSSGSDRRRRSRSLSFCWTESGRGRTADNCGGKSV